VAVAAAEKHGAVRDDRARQVDVERIGDRLVLRLHSPMLYGSTWREAPIVATDRQFGVGSIFCRR
jgi:hypothetical protein